MHISTLCARAVEDHLNANLPSEFASRDLGSYAVKVGRLQSNPERPTPVSGGSVNLMIHVQKPRDEEWFDEPVGDRYIRTYNAVMGYEQGTMSPIGEIGQGQYFYRRFTIEGSIFFTKTKEDREDAHEITHTVRGIVENLMTPDVCLGTTDEWGEQAWRLILGPSKAQERGGERAIIWDFWIYFSVETARPF